MTKRKKGKNHATGTITEGIRLQQIGQNPMYKLRYAKVSLGIMKWMVGIVLVPAGFQFYRSGLAAKTSFLRPIFF